MIADLIKNRDAYPILNAPKFKLAFEWLDKNRADPPATGVHHLDLNVRAIVETYKPEPIGTRDFENHRKYIDIQYLAEGIEWLFWTKPLDLPVKKEYNEGDDIEFFSCMDPVGAGSLVRLQADLFVVLMPGDWHMPCIAPSLSPEKSAGTDPVLKFVFKIPI